MRRERKRKQTRGGEKKAGRGAENEGREDQSEERRVEEARGGGVCDPRRTLKKVLEVLECFFVGGYLALH